jgi:hypothetical protein
MQQLDKIFLGNTPADQRKFITLLFSKLKDKYPKLIIPAVGQFTLAKCAVKGGYKPENIYTSDISFFSSIVGYFYADRPIEDLGFTLKGSLEEYESYTTQAERVAFLLYLIKLKQIRVDLFYERVVFDDLVENKEKHIATLAKQLEKNKEQYKGIKYDVKDLRDEIHEGHSDDTLMIINPPAFANGYVKMFKLEDIVEWQSGIEEFDLKKEYKNLYDETKKSANERISEICQLLWQR